MDLLLTALALVVLVGCLFAYTRAESHATAAHTYLMTAEKLVLGIRQERDRITVLEREIDALRRELRKLSGKFYAAQRAQEEPTDSNPTAITDPLALHPYCENYKLAQDLGPRSEAAQCQCAFCEAKRAQRRAFRNQQAAAGHLDPTWVKAHAGGQVDAQED